MFQADGRRIPHLRKASDVLRNPKTKFRSLTSDRTFKAKTLTAHRTLQHICKPHKTHRTEANLTKELQLTTHGKYPAVRHYNTNFLSIYNLISVVTKRKHPIEKQVGLRPFVHNLTFKKNILIK